MAPKNARSPAEWMRRSTRNRRVFTKSRLRGLAMNLRSWKKGILAGVFAVLALSVFATMASAQGRGTLTVRVTDTSGGVLQGARIQVEPIGLTVASGQQGQFTINGIDA